MSELKRFEAIDVSQYEGNKVKIAEVEQIEVPSQFNERGMQWVLRVSSENVVEGIRASELFNLREEDGKPVGYSTSSNLWKFMEKLGVEDPDDLVGKEATIKARGNFLGFVF